MLPQFPEFKKLELLDRAEIEKITRQYPPFSDFNFVSMWSWDIKEEMRTSLLNDNLVVTFTNYITGETFLSFLGSNKVNETAEAVLTMSSAFGFGDSLRLVPETSVKELDSNKFKVEEDRDNFDYIMPLQVLKEYNTHETRQRMTEVRKLLREFSPEIRPLDLSNIKNQKDIFQLITKSLPDAKLVKNELLAISRFIEAHKNPNLVTIGLYINSELAGFGCSEVLNHSFANFHFWKANTNISKSMYSYLMHEKATLLFDKYGCKFLNIEQDLGIENLRKWKSSFGEPVFLKKYTVSFNK